MLRKENECLATVGENVYNRARFKEEYNSKRKKSANQERYKLTTTSNKSQPFEDENGYSGIGDGSYKNEPRNREYGGGHSTPAEDEGISSSDQDDMDEGVMAVAVIPTSSPYATSPGLVQLAKMPVMEAENNYNKIIRDVTIDDVMEDFKNLIDDVQRQCCEGQKGNKDGWCGNSETNQHKSQSEALILDKDDDNDIIPTKILPEPPKKVRTLTRTCREVPYLENINASGDNNDSTIINKVCKCDNLQSKNTGNVETNPFFEDETTSIYSGRSHWPPLITDYTRLSYCSNLSGSSSSSSSHSLQPSPSTSPLPQHGCHIHNKTWNLRRSETFHELLMDSKEEEEKEEEKKMEGKRENVAGRYSSYSQISEGSGKRTRYGTNYGKNDKMEWLPQSQSKNGGSTRCCVSSKSLDGDDGEEHFRDSSTSVWRWNRSRMGKEDKTDRKTSNVFPRLNPISYFSKTRISAEGGDEMVGGTSKNGSILRRTKNAGLYSGKSHIQSNDDNHLNQQVITITSEYAKRSLNGLKRINLNIYDDNIMNLPSGLY